MIVWALFDSGNGCYTQAFKQWVASEQASEQASDRRIFPIGIDVNGRKGDFIELN